MKNYKEIVEAILEIGYAHNLIFSTGFSHAIDISTIRTDQYPLFYVTPTRVSLDESIIIYYYTFYALDQLRKGDVNGLECFSDMVGVLNDIIIYINNNLYKIVFMADGDAIFEDYDSSLRGWSLSVGISVPNDANNCFDNFTSLNEKNFDF